MLVEMVEVPLVRPGVEFPEAVLLIGEDHVLAAGLGLCRAPHVIVAVGVVRAAARRLEPRVAVRRVVHDEVDDDPYTGRFGGAHKFDEVAMGPQTWVDTEEVGDVVTVVPAGRRVEGHEPQTRHAEVEEILDALRHTADIAAAVTVPGVEGLHVGAVEDGVFPPQVAGVAAPHAIAARVGGAVGDSCGSTCSPNASMKPDCSLPTKCRYSSSQPWSAYSRSHSVCWPKSLETSTDCFTCAGVTFSLMTSRASIDSTSQQAGGANTLLRH